jgi:hypothetical protein
MEYTFHFDEKVTVWCRSTFYINAESLDEAKEIVMKHINDNTLGELLVSGCEYNYHTQTRMLPIKNGGLSTEEVVCEDTDEIIYQNGENVN